MKLGWDRDASTGTVIVAMTPDDWARLLFFLGFATGDASRCGDVDLARQMVMLTNRLNVGNPNYTPYKVEELP